MCFADMYLEIFLADFAVFRVFWGISRDFAEIPEFRGSATARIIRSPDLLCLCSKSSIMIILLFLTDNVSLSTSIPQEPVLNTVI